MRRHRVLFLVWLTCFGFVTQAVANGRFPRSQRLIRDPGDPTHMVLAGTFGLAITRDGGQSWVHVCESAFSDPNTILDPLVGFAKDRTLFTGTLVNLRRSDPAVCEFDVVLGGPGELVPDYTFDVDGQTVVAAVSSVVDGKDRVTLQTSPDGATWQVLGMPIDDRSVLTLDVAPSDGERLYLSALAPIVDAQNQTVGQRGVLLVSRDRAQSFEELDIPGTSFDAQPFIAAVHPTDPDVVYVRLDARKLDAFDLPLADDALLISRDAGQTWQELIRRPAKLFAFTLSPDATTVLVGFGQPDDSTLGFEPDHYGMYRLTPEAGAGGAAGDPQVEHFLNRIPVHCVTWTEERLYVCMKQFEAGFELGFTDNHAFTELDELTPLLLLTDVEGPSTCQSGSEAGVCSGLWQTDCLRLFACGATPSTGGAAGDGSGAGGEAGASGVDAGGMNGGAGASTGGTSAGDPAPEEPSKCACRLVLPTRWPEALSRAMPVYLLVLVWARRRRRRTSSSTNGNRA